MDTCDIIAQFSQLVAGISTCLLIISEVLPLIDSIEANGLLDALKKRSQRESK